MFAVVNLYASSINHVIGQGVQPLIGHTFHDNYTTLASNLHIAGTHLCPGETISR